MEYTGNLSNLDTQDFSQKLTHIYQPNKTTIKLQYTYINFSVFQIVPLYTFPFIFLGPNYANYSPKMSFYQRKYHQRQIICHQHRIRIVVNVISVK